MIKYSYMVSSVKLYGYFIIFYCCLCACFSRLSRGNSHHTTTTGHPLVRKQPISHPFHVRVGIYWVHLHTHTRSPLYYVNMRVGKTKWRRALQARCGRDNFFLCWCLSTRTVKTGGIMEWRHARTQYTNEDAFAIK